MPDRHARHKADFIGMPGPSGSPALFGGDLMLVRRFRESPWGEAALVLERFISGE
jgi:hypothetical protein